MSTGRVWFTSDLHLGHNRVAALRGFETTLDHDLSIFDRWREQVGPKDQVWVLGDIAVSDPRHALATLRGLPGEKHLIWGNHDQGHPMHRDAHRKAAKYLEVFASAQAFARRRVGGFNVLLSHFPYDGDTPGRDYDRFGEYRLRDEGYPLIHGHEHSTRRLSYSYDRTSEQVHVGWDAWRRLVSLDEIAEMVA